MDDFIPKVEYIEDELPEVMDDLEELCDHTYVYTEEDDGSYTGTCIECDFEADYTKEDLITEYNELV